MNSAKITIHLVKTCIARGAMAPFGHNIAPPLCCFSNRSYAEAQTPYVAWVGENASRDGGFDLGLVNLPSLQDI